MELNGDIERKRASGCVIHLKDGSARIRNRTRCVQIHVSAVDAARKEGNIMEISYYIESVKAIVAEEWGLFEAYLGALLINYISDQTPFTLDDHPFPLYRFGVDNKRPFYGDLCIRCEGYQDPKRTIAELSDEVICITSGIRNNKAAYFARKYWDVLLELTKEALTDIIFSIPDVDSPRETEIKLILDNLLLPILVKVKETTIGRLVNRGAIVF